MSFGSLTRQTAEAGRRAQVQAQGWARAQSSRVGGAAGSARQGCTITLVMQCTSDEAERASHLPLTLGNLRVGWGSSKDSISFYIEGAVRRPSY